MENWELCGFREKTLYKMWESGNYNHEWEEREIKEVRKWMTGTGNKSGRNVGGM